MSLVAMFTDDARQMKIGGLQLETHFLVRFAAGAMIGRFAGFLGEFAAARTPASAVGFLGPFQQQDLVLRVEDVEQRGDFIGQRHRPLLLAHAIEVFGGADKQLALGHRDGGAARFFSHLNRGKDFEFVTGVEHDHGADFAETINLPIRPGG